MQIIKEPTRNFKYAFDSPFRQDVVTFCRALKARVGFKQFGFYTGRWRFNDLNMIQIIQARFPETVVLANLQDDIERFEKDKVELEARLKRAEELKTATDSKLEIKGVTGGELYPYQKIGVEFFINNDGKAILADTMGLGKTLQTLAYITHTGQSKTLVICPASSKYVWEKEVKKWTELKYCVIDSNTNLRAEVPMADIFIINYDILKKHFKTLMETKWDCIAMDEFHYIKNNSAQRTKMTKAIAGNVQRILLLSGTPLLSRPAELFNGLNLMDPVKWSDYYSFTKRYCDGHAGRFGWEAKGASNIEELQQRIGQYFLRRNKDEVLTELPPKRFISVPVELTPEHRREYDKVMKDFQKYLIDVKKKTTKEAKKSMQAEKLVRLGHLRQITTAGKYKSALEWVRDLVDSGQKVVVFSVYNEPLEMLKKEFGDEAVVLTGKIKKEERDAAIETFQNDEKTKIFLGGIKSAGVSITLTASPNVLFIDFSWVPADHDQAADRIHRIGQTKECTIYQMYAIETIDDYMQELLSKKKAIFNQLIEGLPDSTNVSDTLFKDLLEHIKNEKKT